MRTHHLAAFFPDGGHAESLKENEHCFRNVLLMPYLMPSSAMLLIWLTIFDYGGVINRIVAALGMSGCCGWKETPCVHPCLLYLEEPGLLGGAVFRGAGYGTPQPVRICLAGGRGAA